MTFFDKLKSVHKFVSDGYHKVSGALKSIDTAQIDKLIKRSGLQIDNAKEIVEEGGGWQGLISKFMGSEQFQTGALQAAEALVVTGAGGGLSALGPVLGSLVVDQLKYLGLKEKTDTFKAGDWVTIDNGEQVLSAESKRAISWTETDEFFGESPIEEDMKEFTEHLVSYGFVISHANSEDLNVFNLEYGEQRQVPLFDVQHIKGAKAVSFRTNTSLNSLKDLVLNKKEVLARLGCDVPCDPGEEVVVDGKTFTVRYCDGVEAVLENGEETKTVNMNEVERGRVTHTNSWDYAIMANTPTGFDREIRPKFFTGQFVWMAPQKVTLRMYPDCNRELVVVRIINNNLVDGYYAMNGERVSQNIGSVEPVTEELSKMFNHHKLLKKFQQAAVVGRASVRDYAVGATMGRLVANRTKLTPTLSFGGEDEGTIKPATPGALLYAAPVPAQVEGEIITAGGMDDRPERRMSPDIIDRETLAEGEQKKEADYSTSLAIVAVGALVTWAYFSS